MSTNIGGGNGVETAGGGVLSTLGDTSVGWITVVKILPNYLWVGLAAWTIWLFKDPLRSAIPRVSSFRGFGMTFELAADMAAAIEVAEKHPNWPVQVSEAARNRAAGRAWRAKKLLKGARLLWVDDRPANNGNEQRMFNKLGIQIEFAMSTQDALRLLAQNPAGFDAIISDMKRIEAGQENKYAGLDFLAKYRQEDGRLPVIFYIGTPNPSKGTPLGAFGLTHRPDELLHLVIDMLERDRG